MAVPLGAMAASSMPTAGGAELRQAPCLQQASQFSWQVRDLCRRRLLVEMVGQVLERRAVCSGPGALLVMVMDRETQQLTQSICQLSDVLEAKVSAVERLDAPRQALPGLTALYFVAPGAGTVERLLRDLSDSGPKYSGLHVFFSHQPSPTLLRRLAASPNISKLHSFQELNLGFLPHDDRAFHLGDRGVTLAALLEGSPPETEQVAEAARRLATLPMLLGIRPRVLYAAHSTGARGGRGTGAAAARGGGVCEALAAEVCARLDEVEARGALWAAQGGSGAALRGTCDLLIVDRAFDWTPLLVHDMHYEALAYDMLSDSAVIAEGGQFKRRTPAAPDAPLAAVPDQRDELWQDYRHLPLWRVTDDLVARIDRWQRRNDEMRPPAGTSTEGSVSAKAVSLQVARTLEAVQGLPQHMRSFEALLLQQQLCLECKQALGRSLLRAATFEQDLAAGVAADGRARRLSAPQAPAPRQRCCGAEPAVRRELGQYLEDPHLDADAKLRLLLLYLASPEGLKCPVKDRFELAAHLPGGRHTQFLAHCWASLQRPEPRQAASRRRRRCRERLGLGRPDSSPRSADFSRWEPRLRQLLEDLAAGTLDPQEFPECRPPEHSVTFDPVGHRALIVFVVGGVTLPEARVAHEFSAALGIEAFVGGNCLLTPGTFLQALPGAEAASTIGEV